MFNNIPMCGGTTQSCDENAPKEILSDDMVFFKVSAALGLGISLNPDAPKSVNNWIDYISVYAALLDKGVLLSLNARNRYDRSEYTWGLINENIFAGLVKAVREQNLAARNGTHSFTNGLPENFGGEVLIKYSDGEKISYSNNQSPVISKDFGIWLYEFFRDALNKERAPLPDAKLISEVRFYEKNSSGYVRAELSKKADDTYEIYKVYKFAEPELFEHRASVSADVINNIREIASNNALLIWNSAPRSEYPSFIEKSLTFVLENGEEITVFDNCAVPDGLSNGFFRIERELVDAGNG